jgi:hypothetical protein
MRKQGQLKNEGRTLPAQLAAYPPCTKDTRDPHNHLTLPGLKTEASIHYNADNTESTRLSHQPAIRL